MSSTTNLVASNRTRPPARGHRRTPSGLISGHGQDRAIRNRKNWRRRSPVFIPLRISEHFQKTAKLFMPHDFAAVSVNARVEPIEVNGKKIKPSAWIDENLPVEQMTWASGLPEVIRDKLVSDGGWIDHAGASTFNLYRACDRSDPYDQLQERWHLSSGRRSAALRVLV